MEVNGLTTKPINHFANQVSGSITHPANNSDIPVSAQRSNVKIESITMDLEEMKDFLFMMLRGGAIKSDSGDERIGRIVNKFA